eukprot:scaffold1669_cov129-Cylindrotheca_fusiformis.AAC.60
MRQVQHGADLTNALKDTANDLSDEDLRPLIQAQLSHSDGIRGLMVAFLTAEDDDSVAFRIPNVMVQALQEQAQSSPVELIPLAFMNVIMPTAMKTMHQDDELRQSSSRTARRAFCVLQALAGKHPSVENNAKAVQVVASNKTVDEYDALPSLIRGGCRITQEFMYLEWKEYPMHIIGRR